MSAIGGIHNFDGAIPSRKSLEILERGLESRGPDGGATLLLDNTAMVFRAFPTNREAAAEVQPLALSAGELLSWDGRLDNRQELIGQCRDELARLKFARLVPAVANSRFTVVKDESDLAAERDRGRTPGDAELVMAAFQKWGTDVFSHLLGDYALAIWNHATRSLYLARDPFGMRPLFFQCSTEQVIWSSEIEPLVALAGNPERIDEVFVAGFLTVTERLGHTPYADISSVVPGHAIEIKHGAIRTVRRWVPDAGKEISYASDREYEEHFRQLFREAVVCRLRADGPVMAELSGGMDSSSIVCMADELLQSDSVQARTLETVSFLYDGSATCDEREFIGLVEEKRGRPGSFLLDENILGVLLRGEVGALPNPQQLFGGTFEQLFKLMRQSGARVLLSGHGGDHVLMNDPTIVPSVSDLVSRGRIFQAASLLRAFGRANREPYIELAWKGVAWPHLPDKLKVRWAPHYLRVPPWISPSFSERTGTPARKVFSQDAPVFRKASRQYLYNMVKNAISVISAGYYRERGCVEISCPFLHRPLVEFLLAIPSQQLVRPGDARSLLRRSTQGLLPEKIRLRRDKRGPDEAIYKAIQREWPGLMAIFADAQVFARGYIDGDVFRQTLRPGSGWCPRRNRFCVPWLLKSGCASVCRARESAASPHNSAVLKPVARTERTEKCTRKMRK